ncbi:DNA repair protein RecN [Geomonas sp. RF6]|uniref:DNA repair protein RecN n=1 Tax=Geomonas sp. RF6 TaxID=2897342 RepID=UPI001E2E7892|nr:DNA repair protein RecN [Geomonas sp. RF6]UFS70543.1 DNA repair protein RecN [Geomonas sp. RF6]
MLRELNIRNLAIIEQLHVEFHGGLNILTGETGAGKSIIIDAVNLILGGRASSDLIRSGSDEASVEALFDLSERPDLLSRVAELGIDCDSELLVRRVVSRGGKNRVFIGGGLGTTSMLSELSRALINISGQHESQTLMKSDRHLHLLDGFAGLLPQRTAYAALFEEYCAVKGKIAELDEGEREAARRLDLLSFQSEEIGGAKLSVGEEEELEAERRLLVHGEKLLTLTTQAFDALYGGDGALIGALSRIRQGVAEANAIDAKLAPAAEALEGALAQLEDASLTLRDYAAGVESDPERLASLEDRLDLLHRLKKKYGDTVAEILAYKEGIDIELEELSSREESRGKLDARLEELATLISKKGVELGKGRRAAAQKLKSGMERELSDLAMPHAVFETAFEECPEPRGYGLERAEFLFSPNPGEPPKPLAKTASGGELSRILLALKQLHPESEVPTLIFDEVDTGMGGATSALVGAKLKKVAAMQQVLAITHLPQVAARADQHLRVEKVVQDGRTTTAVTPLLGEERVTEVARMLGAARVTEKTREHAREMIEEAVHGA